MFILFTHFAQTVYYMHIFFTHINTTTITITDVWNGSKPLNFSVDPRLEVGGVEHLLRRFWWSVSDQLPIFGGKISQISVAIFCDLEEMNKCIIDAFEGTICLIKVACLYGFNLCWSNKYYQITSCTRILVLRLFLNTPPKTYGWTFPSKLVGVSDQIRPGRFEVPLQAFAMQRHGMGKVSKKVCTYKTESKWMFEFACVYFLDVCLCIQSIFMYTYTFAHNIVCTESVCIYLQAYMIIYRDENIYAYLHICIKGSTYSKSWRNHLVMKSCRAYTQQRCIYIYIDIIWMTPQNSAAYESIVLPGTTKPCGSSIPSAWGEPWSCGLLLSNGYHILTSRVTA